MNNVLISTAAVALALAGCDRQQAPTTEANATAAADQAETARTYSGAGKVSAIADGQVTIAHGPIEGIGWPAMTMSFTAPGSMAETVQVGSDVSFAFRQDGGTYVLSRLQKR